MRIISQDGMIDIPYDLSALSLGTKENNFCIYVRSKLLDEKPCIFATYSTGAKAIKAIEMLRKAYTGTFLAQDVKLPENGMEELQRLMKYGYGCLTVYKEQDNVRFEPLNIRFQFPADDEIEV